MSEVWIVIDTLNENVPNKEFSTSMEAKNFCQCTNDVKYHKIGNDIVVEYYFVVIAVIRKIGETQIPDPPICFACGK